jgi:MFS family permease
VRVRDRIVTVLVIGAVGLAFADASVVALALPDLYGEFDTSIVGVSWVLTTYALAVALTAMPVALLHRRVRPLALVVSGVAVFAAASLVAGAATSLTLLLVARAAQGVGATLLLAGSLPVLGALVPGDGRARRWWALAGAVGAAVGPALGGVLTELFAWRSIFFVQAPIVAAALAVAFVPSARHLRREGRVSGAADSSARDVVVANVGFGLVFAALASALFLGVLLAIEVWRYSPVQSALLVSALPLGMVVGRRFQRAPGRLVAAGGAGLLALGLLGLAFVPGAHPVMAAIAFAVCGVGFDLVHEVLDDAAVPGHGPAVRASAVSIGARHAGLVVGLALIAPVLSSSLDAGIERATLGATRTMLTTRLEVRDKIRIAWSLRDRIEEAPKGQVPDLAAEFDERGADERPELARSRDELMDTVTAAVTRAFRPAFVIAAILAALSALAALGVVNRRRAPGRGPPGSHDPANGTIDRPWPAPRQEEPMDWPAPATTMRPRRRLSVATRVGAIGIGLVAAIGVGLIVAEFADGARDSGTFVAEDPCTAPPDSYPGDGYDASIQRIALSALNGAACELGTTRERLILSLDGKSGFRDVAWDDETLEQALKVGAHRAIDDANDRDAIPGWVAAALGWVVDRAPIDWLVEEIDLPGF